MTYVAIVDPDMVTMVLDDAEHTRAASRAAIDAIARRVEADAAKRGVGVDVRRVYATTGTTLYAHEQRYPAEWMEQILVGDADAIRAEALG